MDVNTGTCAVKEVVRIKLYDQLACIQKAWNVPFALVAGLPHLAAVGCAVTCLLSPLPYPVDPVSHPQPMFDGSITAQQL